MTTLTEWAHTYTAHLPPELRPNPDDLRFTRAVQNARANGWRAKHAADAVARHNYQGKNNPVLIAIMRLEEITTDPPHTGPHHDSPRTHSDAACPWPGCLCTHTDCFKGWIDQHDGPTRPCPQCRPELQRRLGQTPPPGSRTPADQAYLRDRDRR